jgi:enamine deaminase RidA (YjgF/YER057c/UK114 family)
MSSGAGLAARPGWPDVTGPHARLRDLGLVLPPLPLPQGSYRPVRIHGGLAYVAGQVSRHEGGVIAGPVEPATPPDTIAAAARACTLRALAVLDGAIGLDRVGGIVFLRGFVFAGPSFHDHPKVLDHVSHLLIAVFGDSGHHARSAVGVAGLPAGGMLEIELVAEIAPGP